MRETQQERINRLKGRKGELVGQVKALWANPGRNVEHKVEMLNQQVLRLGARIIKLKGDKYYGTESRSNTS